jgi:hypothetical protein
VKTTVPVGALRLDRLNLESVAVTVTWVVAVDWAVACDALELAPPPATKIPAASPATATTASGTRLPPRRMTLSSVEPARTVYKECDQQAEPAGK